MAKPSDQCFTELVQSRTKSLCEELEATITQNAFESLYRSVFQRLTRKDRNPVRAKCPTTN